MRSLRKTALIGLAVLTVAAASWAAPQIAPPYPTDYRGLGTLDKGAAPDATNYKVVIYKNTGDLSSGYAAGFTDGNGIFNLNIHDDLRLLPLVANQTYYVGVVKKLASDKKSYGVDETALTSARMTSTKATSRSA